MTVEMVRVRVIKDSLRHTYGSFMHLPLQKATQGQRKGYWEIVERAGGENQEPFVSAKDVLADVHSDRYMTKGQFDRVSKQALSFKDVFGRRKGAT